MQSWDIAAGTPIFSEGDIPDRAYLVESGEVEISRRHDGQPRVLARLGPGEVFGEMGVIDGCPRSANARALTDCLLISVPADQIRHVIARSDPFFAELMRKLVGRLRDSHPHPVAPPLQMSEFGAGYAKVMRERDIAEAIISGDIEPYLQPIVDPTHGATILGYETLARWRSETLGLMRPFDFLPLARRTGLIRRVDLTMADRAMGICARLDHDAGPNAPFVSINISAWALTDPDLMAALPRMAAQHGIAPGHLCLEVTETMLIDDLDTAERAMEELRHLGFRLALDDFGTGLSSIAVLHRLPFHMVKVDGSLVQGCQTSARQRALLQGILDLCGRLDMEVVAEGIEDAATARTLAELGYTMGQGMYFAPPAEAESAMTSWREGRKA